MFLLVPVFSTTKLNGETKYQQYVYHDFVSVIDQKTNEKNCDKKTPPPCFVATPPFGTTQNRVGLYQFELEKCP